MLSKDSELIEMVLASKLVVFEQSIGITEINIFDTILYEIPYEGSDQDVTDYKWIIKNIK